jgi:hypothetical protein
MASFHGPGAPAHARHTLKLSPQEQHVFRHSGMPGAVLSHVETFTAGTTWRL